MSKEHANTISVDGIELKLIVERKRVKNINARLRGNVLLVSAPQALPASELDPIILKLASRLMRRVHQAHVNADEEALAVVRRVAARFPNPPAVSGALFVTTQIASWGSYSSATGGIRLNASLRRMPMWVIEAVAAHELAHAVHPNHSPAFWRLLREVYPDVDKADAFLAGASWLAQSWDQTPAIERSLLSGATWEDLSSDGDPDQDG